MFVQRIIFVWAVVMAVTSGMTGTASLRTKILQFDPSVAVEQYTDVWVIELVQPETHSNLFLKANELAKKHGFINQGQVGELDGFFSFKLLENDDRRIHSLSGSGKMELVTQALENDTNVGYTEQQIFRKKFKKDYSYPNDPNFKKQWSLINTGQTSGRKGLDLNVEPVWLQGITGKGIVVSIVDDGLEVSHPDLAPNYDSDASWDFVGDDNDPTPSEYFGDEPDRHGTSCAGEIAMAKDNNKCGVGVAYESNIGCLKLTLSTNTDSTEASSLGYKKSYIQVYSNSWGPSDNGFTVEKPGILLEMTLENAVKNGRDGKGSIFVWAAGNGGWNFDSCAADGYASSIYTIAVGSADQTGSQASYDESCAGKMAVTYSFNSQTFSETGLYDPYDQIYTTTLNGQCTNDFTGTSASAPLLSGVITLGLQANPELTWRDVQYLLAYTSNPDFLIGGKWEVNGAGLNVSHEFGFGAVDAEAFVTRAKNWVNVPQQISEVLTSYQVRIDTARYRQPLKMQFTVSSGSSNINFLEHVVLTASLSIIEDLNSWPSYSLSDYLDFINSDTSDVSSLDNWLQDPHPRRGDIKIELISPQGTSSILLPHRRYDFINYVDGQYVFNLWPFMSVHYWGENPVGNWTMIVTFKSTAGTVRVSDVELTLYGTTDIPQAVADIPQTCDDQCARGCYGSGPNVCDVCKRFRIVSTLECVDTCPDNTFQYKNSYCTNSSLEFPHSSNSVLAISIGVSIGLILFFIGLFVMSCVLAYACKRKKNEREIRSRYRALQSEDYISPVAT